MQKQELQKLLTNQELTNQDVLKSELELLLDHNSYMQDSNNISLSSSISLGTYKYLLENGFSSNLFLENAINIYCYDKKSEDRKLSLVELALSYKADPNSLLYFSQITEECLNILLSNGLTLNNAFKLVLSMSVKYDFTTQKFIEDQEKIILRDKIAINLINQGIDLNNLLDEGLLNHRKLLSLLTSQKEFILKHPVHPLTPNNYIKVVFSADQPSDLHKNMLREAFAMGVKSELINNLQFYINIEKLFSFKDILLQHLSLDHLLELTISLYIPDSKSLEFKEQLIVELIEKGADFNSIFKKSTYYLGDMVDFIHAHEEYLLNHPVHPLTPNNYLQAALKMNTVNRDGVLDQTKLDIQSKMLERALSSGVNIHKILEKGESLSFEMLEYNKDLILKHAGASHLLLWSISSFSYLNKYGYDRNKTYEEKAVQTQKAIDLVKFAIANGADINFNYSGSTALDLADNKEIIALLKSHGAESSNTQLEEFYQNGLHHLLWHPEIVFEKKYKHLNVEPSTEAKMPYIIHHIWLTHPDNPQEIRSQDIENAIKTKDIFAKSDANWTHIVWTNDKNLIPESLKKLAEHNIEVRSIYDYQEVIPSIDLISNLINQKKWGMASDTLRYSIIEELGGVYADINYTFNRDVTSEVHKYNFFSSTYGEYYIDNFFFGASAHHPVVQKMVELTERNLVNPPEYLSNIQNQDSRVITDMGTANPTFIAYYLEANKHGNIDVIYPVINSELFYRDSNGFIMRVEQDTEIDYIRHLEIEQTKGIDDLLFNYFNLYIHNNEICGADSFYIGRDSPDGQTWVN